MTARVTVLVLTFNQARFVRECLDGILEQIAPFEIDLLVHDDFSTDGTREILKSYEEEYPGRIQVNYHPYNYYSVGKSIACAPLLEIDSPYVAFCEGDDFWHDRFKLAKQMDFMRQNPWCSISHHPVGVLNDGGDAEYAVLVSRTLNKIDGHPIRMPGARVAQGNYIATCSVMLRRENLRDDFLRSVYNIQPEDWLIFAAASESGDVGYLQESMATYRLHGNNAWAGQTAEGQKSKSMEAREFLQTHLIGESQQILSRS